ncbi:MAG: hypothetical protein ACQESX_10360 [Bacteroidota bacterium]
MKKIGLFFMVFGLLWNYQPAQAQESVDEAYTFGERCLEKIRNRRFRKFDETYSQALKDMQQIEQEAASTQFGYENLIEYIPNWIKLNDLLRKFDSESISNKGETITFQLKDYRKILEDAKVKAAKDRVEAGKQIIAGHSDISKTNVALIHFKKAESYSGNFNDEIKEQGGILYYKAGESYSESGDIEKVKKAQEFFTQAKELNPDYKDVDAALKGLNQKGAGLLYDMALAKEKEMSFEAQLEAARYYEEIGEKWIEDYKDAAEKAKAARDRGTVNIYFIGKYGKILSNPKACNNLEFINTPEPSAELKNLDLRKEENYAKAVDIAGKGFILAKPTPNFGEMEYFPPETTTSQETHEAYVKLWYTGGRVTQREKITESEYNKAKRKLGDEISDKEGFDWKKVTGVSTRKEISNRMLLKCPLEIWDLRDPNSPEKLGEIDVGWSEGDLLVRTTYSGADEAKPNHLKNDSRENLQSKAILASLLKKKDSSVAGSIERKRSTLHYDLPKLIKYRE